MIGSTKVQYGLLGGGGKTHINDEAWFSGTRRPQTLFNSLPELVSALAMDRTWFPGGLMGKYEIERITTTSETKTARRIEELESARTEEKGAVVKYAIQRVGDKQLMSSGKNGLVGEWMGYPVEFRSTLAEAFALLSTDAGHEKLRVVRVVDIETTTENVTTEILK